MKKYRYIGLIALTIFSFFYTEKIAKMTLEKNPLYVEIKESSKEYTIESVDAQIDKESIIPGLNGKSVDIKTSFYNMKELDAFNSYYLVFDTSYPKVSIEKNKDKIIERGNSLKNSVSLVVEYDKKNIEYFKKKNIEVSVLVDVNSFSKDETFEQINNENKNYNNLDSILNKYNKNTNLCYINNNIEKKCRDEKKYLVKSKKIVDDNSFINIKNNIESGDIYYIKKNINPKNINILINSILYKDLDIVRLSKLLSEERD